ncbi:MAG: TRAP transporter large permease subunit [Leptospiraceae bacterium]|nr:TRAP transporter large permease subunit [Leptospiraceae bacterium]
MADVILVCFVLVTIALLMSGYPVAFTLSGAALLFAGIGALTGNFDFDLTIDYPNRLFGIMSRDTLIAIPLFVFMGVVLEKTRLAEDLLETMALLFGPLRGGLGISVFIVGALLAASTGIVGATVVTMGLISMPAMLKHRYQPSLASGIITASGTLGQIIPPSIILIILGDQIGSAYQEALRKQGNWSGANVSVGELFLGALLPGLLLVVAYIIYIALLAWMRPESAPAVNAEERARLDSHALARRVVASLLPPVILIVAVLGSILLGWATATEAASVGAIGALGLAYLKKSLHWDILRHSVQETARVNSMVFLILIGANLFALVFRGLGGDASVEHILSNLPGGTGMAFTLVMLMIFILGFFLDFFEITFVVVPIVGPILLAAGMNPVWLGVMIALNLQTSFLTPPFGFALFYLRGVAPASIPTLEIYKGVVPFIGIQLLLLLILALFPQLATALPELVYGGN